MLLEFLLSLRTRINSGLLGPALTATDSGNWRVSEIINYINTHYGEKMTLDFLANRFFIDKYYLCRIFKKISGMTVVEYMNYKRLIEAKKLIETSEHSISAISNLVGFQNQNHFNLLFKRLYGYTPSQIRASW
jgi:YesN/AraC family two-component response regulator